MFYLSIQGYWNLLNGSCYFSSWSKISGVLGSPPQSAIPCIACLASRPNQAIGRPVFSGAYVSSALQLRDFTKPWRYGNQWFCQQLVERNLRFDSNGDGNLSFHEFVAALAIMIRGTEDSMDSASSSFVPLTLSQFFGSVSGPKAPAEFRHGSREMRRRESLLGGRELWLVSN